MADINHRRSADEQYKLIMECRSSGLSDHQWCMEHDIKPGTFYNWVKRLRRKACYDIPEATRSQNFAPATTQEVVQLEIVSDTCDTHSVIPATSAAASTVINHPVIANQTAVIHQPPIRISFGNVQVDLSNEVNPELLSRILLCAGQALC